MKTFKATTLLLAAAATVFMVAGCSATALPDSDGESGAHALTFLFSVGPCPGFETATKADGSPGITAIWYAVADSDGNTIQPMHRHLADDLSALKVEGLKSGDYSIVFLASTEQSVSAEVHDIQNLSDTWLSAALPGRPVDEEWLWNRTDLHISAEQPPMTVRIPLERCVGRIDVDLNPASEYVDNFIRKVTVSFDETSNVHFAMKADGKYSSPGKSEPVDITEKRSFLSFPSAGALSGTVSVTASRSDGGEFIRTYRFEGCKIEAGAAGRISVNFRHPEEDDGLIKITEADFEKFGAGTMFLANEPQSVFYDENMRSFYAHRPLQAAIDENHCLRIRFYSPVRINDVTVLCRFKKISSEFFEFAHFDTIYPFMEASFPLPVTSAGKRYASTDGRQVIVPAYPELSDSDVELEIRCDDPFMKKIGSIDSRWYICYSKFGADDGHAYWRHMTPELCRHGVALALNMAYLFSTEEFNAEMENYRGLLTDNSGNPIDLDVLRRTIREHSGLTLGHVTGVGGLGGGRTYGLADYCYREVYFDWDPNPDADPHTYSRMAMFHEYGHCLGYSHESTMTYGDQWTVLCSKMFVKMGREGKLPVNSKYEIMNLPM